MHGAGKPAGKLLAQAARLALVALLAGSARGCAPSVPHGTHATPSSTSDDAALKARLAAAVRQKGPGYMPRTRHLNADGSPKYNNRLVLESSPYLLQHAHNPVDWFPWGDEAFERAKALNRPVFLSVGYSTCHWCHVMEEESFEDEEIARYLNEHYVPIKVDREERPDVDAVYMTFVQAFTGSGGWPMSVWLTPSREPFFGGTYFPPRAGARGNRAGFIEILRAHAERFTADPAALVEAARDMASRLRSATAPDPSGDFPPASLLDTAREKAVQRFDPAFGGNRGAPKFPSSFPLRVLLRVARRKGDIDGGEARRMAALTLDRMRAGGMHDHVGGGFHRYSTDARWLVPHFEKMLYDNAQLALVYLEGAEATGDASFAETARETLDYMLREMTSPEGTFYSATDADSPTASGRREEGVFFTWTPAELASTLGDDDARIATAWYGVTQAGNFEGRSVLSTPRSLDEAAKALSRSPADLSGRLAGIRARLYDARAKRPPPLRDDKVIVAWNGLVIAALARAAIALGEPRYAEAAVRAAGALMAPVRAGRPLPHVLLGKREQGEAFADDWVILAGALLDVFELTADPAWLSDAITLMEETERGFADPAHGGYFLTADHHEKLLLRDKPDYDGPIPSASSVAALVWLRLHAFTGDDRFRTRAESTVRAFSGVLSSRPLAMDHMLLALDWATDAVKEVVIVVPEGRGALSPAARPLLDVLARAFAPNLVLAVGTEADMQGALGQRLAWAADKRLRDGRATAYVCERGACKLPTNDPAVLAAQLAEARPY